MDYAKYSEAEKRALLAMMMKLAATDGDRHFVEERMINRVADAMQVGGDVVTSIKTSPEDLSMALPKNEIDRITFMYHLVLIVKADKLLTEEEAVQLRQMGFMLGLRPGLIDDIVDLIYEHINQKMPQQKFMQAVAAYLN